MFKNGTILPAHVTQLSRPDIEGAIPAASGAVSQLQRESGGFAVKGQQLDGMIVQSGDRAGPTKEEAEEGNGGSKEDGNTGR